MSSDRVGAAPRGDFNDADLRYLREALLAQGVAHEASDVTAGSGTDPRVRDLARRAGAAQADDIRAITSILVEWGRLESRTKHIGEPTLSLATSASSDDRAGDGTADDLRFVEMLTAHTKASLSSARRELVEGFGGASRRHAEDSSRASWLLLASLTSLAVPDERVELTRPTA